jgi:RNA polymerase sigma-70 factor (ECF subfamily)
MTATSLADAHAKFSARIGENQGILHKVAHAYCPNSEDRKDLVQEIVVQLWKSYDRYDARFKFSTWMYRVALNTAISAYRRTKRRTALVVPEADILSEPATEPADCAPDSRIEELHRIIGGLNELNRALMLLYLEDRSYQEIATILGITETNVATKLNRLKQRIRDQFGITQNQHGTR